MKKPVFLICYFLLIISCIQAQKNIVVQAGKPGPSISPTMWGLFFEDINFGADGGLYAELIKNRSFEFPMPLMGWKELKKENNGKILVINREKENPANPRFARITVDASENAYGLLNEGFRGMGIHSGEEYGFSMLARKTSGEVAMQVELTGAAGNKIAGGQVAGLTGEWKTLTAKLKTTDTAIRGKLELLFTGKGTVEVDMISLFPEKTWKNRPNGLRSDLVQLLADLKPGFLRFPGGCIVEGRDLANRYQWKNTVGLPAERKLIMNRWNIEFLRRSAPDYFQTFGLGFYEYFLLSEDLGAEPLPIINCGMACQFNSGEVAALEAMDPYIQDALDLIEFANGDITKKWGKLRAGMGHPEPFRLKLLGVGNEQWDEQYIERYKLFENILKQKHPEIKLVAAAGPSPQGPRFDYAWKQFRVSKADLVDEHYYQNPDWFFENAGRYDNYDRKGPAVFAGEYAAHGIEFARPESKNTWLSALAEAAFMTGLERNADVVKMASYAPLFAHVDAWQWRPDLIWFDNLKAIPTPNYHVQKLFSNNKGTYVLPVLQDGKVMAGRDSLYGSSVMDEKTSTVVVKLVNRAQVSVPVTILIDGKKAKSGKALTEQLYCGDLAAYNKLDDPQTVFPVDRDLSIKNNSIVMELKPYSLTIIKVPVKK